MDGAWRFNYFFIFNLPTPPRMRYNGGMFYKVCTRLAVAALLSAATGCAWFGSTSGGLRVDWLYVLDDNDEITSTLSAAGEDSWLARRVKISPLGASNHSGGLMAMNTVDSLAAKPLSLEYRLEWLDDGGAILPYDFVLWHSLLLKPGEKRFVGRPMPPDAAGYRLTVRRR